jgi:sigma-B regulation protein RsbU (phosphoserine phosphatase)
MAFNDSQRQARNLNALLRVSKALATEIRLDDLLRVIVEEAAEVLDADRATLFLYDESRNELWSKTTQRLEIKEIRVQLGVGIAGIVAKTRTPINISDAYADGRFNPNFDKETGYRTRSILCMPLIGNGDRLIGVIEVLNKKYQEVFDKADESLLGGLSAHITVALERARLIQAYVEKERMEEALKLAHEIQMSMVPKIFPPFPDRSELDIFATLVPAKEVGGDLYDFFFIDDNHLCFAVGDASGKGVPASLFMAVTKTLFKAIAGNGGSPDAILARLNTDICRDNESCMFVTAFCGVLDVRTGRVEYSNAGHNLPYVVSDGILAALPTVGGMALGVSESARFRVGQLRLKPGDQLVLYTDGVTEAMDKNDQLFAEGRLEITLQAMNGRSSKEVVEGVVKAVQRFSTGAPQSDDITLLVLGYMGSRKNDQHTLFVQVRNDPSELQRVNRTVTEFAKKHGLASELVYRVKLVLEEIITNIISYGYEDISEHEISVRLSWKDPRIEIEIKDDGRPFNPLEAPQPDIGKPLVERQIGGLGIHLVRKMMDDLEYRRESDRNCLVLKTKVRET